MIIFEIKVENKEYGQYLIGLIVFSKFAFNFFLTSGTNRFNNGELVPLFWSLDVVNLCYQLQIYYWKLVPLKEQIRE